MFREKISKSSGRGYLYIRESVYIRDKRTLQRKPARLGSGSATLERGKYTKKIDIYCGKIIELKLIKFDTFKEYLTSNNLKFLEFLTSSSFEELFNTYIDYLLHIYDLPLSLFSTSKKVYALGSGYLCPKIIDWYLKFEIRGSSDSLKQFRRFYLRSMDIGIHDMEIIESLYLKLSPHLSLDEVKEEITSMQKIHNSSVSNKQDINSMKDFIYNSSN